MKYISGTLPERGAEEAATHTEPQVLPYAVPRSAPGLSLPTRLGALFALLVVPALALAAGRVTPGWDDSGLYASAGTALVFGAAALFCFAAGRRRDRERRRQSPDGQPALATWARVGCVMLGSAGVVLGGGAILVGATTTRTHCGDSRAACHRNLRQAWVATMLYAEQNKGRLPNTLDDVLNTQQTAADVFVCPLQMPTPPAPAGVPYVYVGRGMKNDIGVDVVVLHDRPGDHPDGMNFAFGDGHVQWHDLRTSKKILAELAAGYNPPRPEKLK